jgi:hypothetical protein
VQTPQAPKPQFAVLTCDMASATDPAAVHRVFRMAPNSLQAWNPSGRSFGSNLCLSFACSADEHRTTGTISSASLVLTITLDRQARQASWRAVGASGLTKSHGACSIGPDLPPAGGG